MRTVFNVHRNRINILLNLGWCCLCSRWLRMHCSSSYLHAQIYEIGAHKPQWQTQAQRLLRLPYCHCSDFFSLVLGTFFSILEIPLSFGYRRGLSVRLYCLLFDLKVLQFNYLLGQSKYLGTHSHTKSKSYMITGLPTIFCKQWALKSDDIERWRSIGTNRAQVFVNKSDWVCGSKIRRKDKTILAIKHLRNMLSFYVCFLHSLLSSSSRPIEIGWTGKTVTARNWLRFRYSFSLHDICISRSDESTTEIEQLAQQIYLFFMFQPTRIPFSSSSPSHYSCIWIRFCHAHWIKCALDFIF